MKALKGWLGVFLIFAFGIILGAVLTVGVLAKRVRRLIEGGPERVTEYVTARLQAELKLAPDQKEQLVKISKQTQEELRAIRMEAQPKVSQALVAAEGKVRAILTADQQPKFDQIIRRSSEKWAVRPAEPK